MHSFATVPFINCEIWLEGASKIQMTTKAIRTPLDRFEALQEQLHCDATIRTQDGFQRGIHKIILSEHSSYFAALFTTGERCIHEITDGLPSFTLENISGNILSIIINFIYSGSAWNISEHNVQELVIAADYLNIPNLVVVCTDFIVNNLRACNVIGIVQFADVYNFFELKDKTKNYLMRNFQAIIHQENNGELMALNASDFASILREDFLNVTKESMVWSAIKYWIKESSFKRFQNLPEILRTLRIWLLDVPDFQDLISFIIEHAPRYQDCCRNIFHEMGMFNMSQRVCTPRIPHQLLFAIGGWSAGEPSSTIEAWDARASKWHKIIDMEPMRRRAYHGCIVIKDQIYMIGGYDGVEYYNSCQKFCTVTRKWYDIGNMQCHRCYVSVAKTDDDIIYAMGGYDGNNRQNSVEMYDYRTNQWTMVAPMNIQRSDADATVFHGKVFIAGGFNGHECLDTAEIYDPRTNIWTLIQQPMSCRRSGVSCIAVDDIVYVVGGFDGHIRLSTAEKFVPRSYTWAPANSMHQSRSNFAIEAIEGNIMAIGGFNGTTTIPQVECYNIASDSWIPIESMGICRSALFACVTSPENILDFLSPNREIVVDAEKELKFMEIANAMTTVVGPCSVVGMAIDDEEDTMGL